MPRMAAVNALSSPTVARAGQAKDIIASTSQPEPLADSPDRFAAFLAVAQRSSATARRSPRYHSDRNDEGLQDRPRASRNRTEKDRIADSAEAVAREHGTKEDPGQLETKAASRKTVSSQKNSSESSASQRQQGPQDEAGSGISSSSGGSESSQPSAAEGVLLYPANADVAGQSCSESILPDQQNTFRMQGGDGPCLLSLMAAPFSPMPGTEGSAASPVVSSLTTSCAFFSPATLPGMTGSQGDATTSGAQDTQSSDKSTEALPPISEDSKAFQALLDSMSGRVRHTGSLSRSDLSSAVKSEQSVDMLNPGQAESVEKLARLVRSSVGARQSSLTMRLEPPELGLLRIDVRMNDHMMTLRFQTETQAGHDALHGRMNELRQALEQQGIHLDRVDIDLRPSSPSGDSRSDYRDQSHQQTPTGGGNGSFGHAYGRQDNPLDVPQQTYMPAWSSERGTESEEPGLQEAENVEVVHLTPTGVDCVA